MYCTSIWSRSLPGVATRILIPFLILKRHTGPHVFTCKFTYMYSVFRYWCSVHTTSEKFKDAAFFLNKLDLHVPSTLICYENEVFRKRRFSGRWHQYNSCDFPDRVVFKHKSKMTCDFCVFEFLRWSVDEKYLMRFQSRVKPPFPDSSGIKGIIKLSINHENFREKKKEVIEERENLH